MIVKSKFSYRMYILYPLLISLFTAFISFFFYESYRRGTVFFLHKHNQDWFYTLFLLIAVGVLGVVIFQIIGSYKRLTILKDHIEISSPYYKKRVFKKEDVQVEYGITSTKVRRNIKLFKVISGKHKISFIEYDFRNYKQLTQALEDNGYQIKGR